MKRVIIIRLKKLIVPALIAILIGGIAFIKGFSFGSATQTSSKQYDPPQGSSEWLYNDDLKTVLLPYVQGAVSNYYEENTGYSPIVDIWGNSDIISIKRLNGYTFIIKFEVSPYLGAHNSIGVDHITLKVSPSGEVKIENFEHINSYPIPPWLQPVE